MNEAQRDEVHSTFAAALEIEMVLYESYSFRLSRLPIIPNEYAANAIAGIVHWNCRTVKIIAPTDISLPSYLMIDRIATTAIPALYIDEVIK